MISVISGPDCSAHAEGSGILVLGFFLVGVFSSRKFFLALLLGGQEPMHAACIKFKLKGKKRTGIKTLYVVAFGSPCTVEQLWLLHCELTLQ